MWTPFYDAYFKGTTRPRERNPYKDIGKQVDLAFRLEHVNQLRRNPYAIAQATTGLPDDHPKTIGAAQELMEQWNKQNRCSAYVSDDTYEGISIENAVRIIMEEGFLPSTREPTGAIRFTHQRLGIAVVPRCGTDPTKLGVIKLNVAMKVHVERINPNTMCGIGLIGDQEVKGSHFYADIDATWGLRTKMFILKSLSRN